MKYMISWFERAQGSAVEYENAQKRILEVFGQWKAPDNFKIEVFAYVDTAECLDRGCHHALDALWIPNVGFHGARFTACRFDLPNARLGFRAAPVMVEHLGFTGHNLPSILHGLHKRSLCETRSGSVANFSVDWGGWAEAQRRNDHGNTLCAPPRR
jgi:hypothetical protein